MSICKAGLLALNVLPLIACGAALEDTGQESAPPPVFIFCAILIWVGVGVLAVVLAVKCCGLRTANLASCWNRESVGNSGTRAIALCGNASEYPSLDIVDDGVLAESSANSRSSWLDRAESLSYSCVEALLSGTLNGPDAIQKQCAGRCDTLFVPEPPHSGIVYNVEDGRVSPYACGSSERSTMGGAELTRLEWAQTHLTIASTSEELPIFSTQTPPGYRRNRNSRGVSNDRGAYGDVAEEFERELVLDRGGPASARPIATFFSVPLTSREADVEPPQSLASWAWTLVNRMGDTACCKKDVTTSEEMIRVEIHRH